MFKNQQEKLSPDILLNGGKKVPPQHQSGSGLPSAWHTEAPAKQVKTLL